MTYSNESRLPKVSVEVLCAEHRPYHVSTVSNAKVLTKPSKSWSDLSRSEIAANYGGAIQGGIQPSNCTTNLLIYRGPDIEYRPKPRLALPSCAPPGPPLDI